MPVTHHLITVCFITYLKHTHLIPVPERAINMKYPFVLILVWILFPAPIIAEEVPYKVPTQLDVSDFQEPEDKAFLQKFDEIKIPALLKRMIKTDHKFIIPWLRENTAEANDYKVTLEVMRRGVLVTDRQFAWVKKQVDICAEIMHISPTPSVFITGAADRMKAETVDFKAPIILLPSELIDKTDTVGLRFAIGRQMGRIKCDHVFYKTLFSGGLDSLEFALGKWIQELVKAFLGKITDLLLVDWTLAGEISADRAGLIACQDVKAAQQTLLNLRLAMTFERVQLDIDDYLEQAAIIEEKQTSVLGRFPESAQDGFKRWQKSERLANEHPFMLKRVKALQAFSESEAYQQLFQ